MPLTPILEVKGLNVWRTGVPILRDLGVELSEPQRSGPVHGQMVGLLGPSGIGKTTLCRMVAGLDAPDSGSIDILGKPVRRGTVGMVAQHYPLFAHRTVMSNLLVACGRSPAARGQEAMALLDLGPANSPQFFATLKDVRELFRKL